MKIFNSGEGGSSIDNANKLEDEVKNNIWWDILGKIDKKLVEIDKRLNQ